MSNSTSSPASTSITVSIVSHGHGQQVESLVKQVMRVPLVARLILTLNTTEALQLPTDNRLVVVQNDKPKGFGANHNSAFKHCTTPFYCVLNPDIVLREETFGRLLACLEYTKAAVAGPRVLSPTGEQEDNWRRFPTVFSLCLKAVGHDITIMKQADKDFPLFPDWIAGMCMMFDAKHYRDLDGFDESLFLYYEDVDICARLWRKGLAVAASSKATVIHNARRASRREWQHMKWHACSMAKYLKRYSFKMPKADRNYLAEDHE